MSGVKATGGSRTVRVRWDTESDGKTLTLRQAGLPPEMEIPAGIPDDEVADWLSDKTGWCVHGWTEVPRRKPGGSKP